MADEYDDDDLETPEAEGSPEVKVPEAVTFADLKKARKEAEGLRKRLKEAQDQILTSRFDEEVLGLIPEEVTDFDRRVTLAEQYAAKLSASSTPQTDQAPEEAPTEEPTPEEQALAAVGTGPRAVTGASQADISDAEIKALARSDPKRAFELAKAKGRTL